MSLPETLRVKLSSETAEAISVTPVVVQDMAVRELIEHMLGITGKDEARIRELLRRGTLVSGASRFRWNGWEADTGSLHELLGTFPDSEPQRPFHAERCVRAVLRGGRQSILIPREAGIRKGFLRRTSFWDLLMQTAAERGPEYLHYSYKDRADCYRAEITAASAEKLRAESDMVRYTTLRDQIRATAFAWIELFVER